MFPIPLVQTPVPRWPVDHALRQALVPFAFLILPIRIDVVICFLGRGLDIDSN